MKKRIFVIVALFSMLMTSIASIINGHLAIAANETEQFEAEEWKYDSWTEWKEFTSDNRLSDSPWAIARWFGANTLYTSESNTYQREYLGTTCASWFLFICTNIDYKYKDRYRNRWYEEGYSKVSENVWVMGSLYEVEETKESKLIGFEQKRVIDQPAYNKVIGYNKKTVTNYTSWSSWKNFQTSSKLSDSSDWIWGSKKYSTATYEREYLGSVCTKRGFLGICKATQYKYRERSRSSYNETVNDYTRPITQYVPETYKYVNDYSKPIYSYGEYEYSGAKLLISLSALVEGIENNGVYSNSVKLNWTHDSSNYGVTYTAKLNGKTINRNYTVNDDGIYFLDITGKNKDGETFVKEMMFAINRNENIAVVDYTDTEGNVVYREFIENGKKSKIETYIEEDKMYINVEKNTSSNLSFSMVENSMDYAHNRFIDAIRENNTNIDNVNSKSTLLFAATLTLTTVEVAAILIFMVVAGITYMATADPTTFDAFGAAIERFFDGAIQLLVDVGNYIWEGLKSAWNWIVSLFVVQTVAESIPYVDDFGKSIRDVLEILGVTILTASTVLVYDKVTSRTIELEYTEDKSAPCRLATTPMFEGYPVVFDSVPLTIEMAAAVAYLGILFLGVYCYNGADALAVAMAASDPGTLPVPHPSHKGGLLHYHPGSLIRRAGKHSHVFYG